MDRSPSLPKRALLMILDGFGNAKPGADNAVSNAKMPFYRELIQKYPHAELITHGEAVGLPRGIMGNSEVGHTTIGAGRIIYQDLTRISLAVENGEFLKNHVLNETVRTGKHATGRVHLMGLVSDGGVHSHIDHLLALLDLCVHDGIPHVSVHCFLDGRDTPPDSSTGFVSRLLEHPAFGPSGIGKTHAVVASVMGRYWAMDRDKRWERVQKAYLAMTGQTEAFDGGILSAIKKSHEAGITDEFVEPLLLDREAAMQDGDSVIFFNYRSDRAREISTAMTEPDFKEFDRGKGFTPSAFAGMAQYDKNLTRVAVAFEPQNLNNIFGEWLEKHQKQQFRIAETEKYAHVTFFFNGGREVAFQGEDRVLVPSPKEVATYDLKPEMSAFGVTKELAPKLREKKYDFVLVNYANADMIGHTGNFEAAVTALEALDQCLKEVVTAAQESGYDILITADHGNAEEMRDEQGRLHTQHTLNPVPIVWVPARGSEKWAAGIQSGGLQDLMPTLCELLNLPVPAEVTGKSLLKHPGESKNEELHK